ncbi:MAG: helix-turn-helix transcriptional regulator, partial [Bryobacteraceae bacterium]
MRGLDFDIKRYGRLLAKTLPRPIESHDECARASAVIKSMMNRDRSPEASTLLQLLVGLVTGYEDRTVPMPDLPPDQMLRSLLESSGMKQTELGKLWGTSKSYTSAIVNGKRPISKAQANPTFAAKAHFRPNPGPP